MRRSASTHLIREASPAPRKKSAQVASKQARLSSLVARGLCCLGAIMVVLLFWRAGRERHTLRSPTGKAAFLHSGADFGQPDDPVLTGTGSRSGLFAGRSALQSLADDTMVNIGTDRAHIAASAGPTQQQSLGFYWGLAGDSQHRIQSTNGGSALAPGLSLEHLQKVAGETGGKAGTGYYFSHDIPETLRAQSEDQLHISPQPHRKELVPSPKAPHPLGVYFQEQAHKAGLAGELGHEAQDGSSSDKPLKYYFTQDIPEDAKRQLAFKNVMKAKMEAQQASGLGA